MSVECIALDGSLKTIPKERLILRPAAFAVVVWQGKLLLLRMRQTGKYHLPGGGMRPEERLEDALKRELKEETGIEIEVDRLAHFEEVFFYYDPSDRAYHGLHFFYLGIPKTYELLDDDRVDDSAAEKPRWREISELRPHDFQLHGEMILKLAREAESQTFTADK